MKKILLLIVFIPTFVLAQNKPKLVVAIVIDQMRYEMLDRFKEDFGSGGFK